MTNSKKSDEMDDLREQFRHELCVSASKQNQIFTLKSDLLKAAESALEKELMIKKLERIIIKMKKSKVETCDTATQTDPYPVLGVLNAWTQTPLIYKLQVFSKSYDVSTATDDLESSNPQGRYITPRPIVPKNRDPDLQKENLVIKKEVSSTKDQKISSLHSSEGNKEFKEGCWKCGSFRHRHKHCKMGLNGIFCYTCGNKGYTCRNCPLCKRAKV